MHRSSGRATPAFSLALFVLMLGCILWLTALGAGLYGSLEASRTANEQTRAALGSLWPGCARATPPARCGWTAAPKGTCWF